MNGANVVERFGLTFVDGPFNIAARSQLSLANEAAKRLLLLGAGQPRAQRVVVGVVARFKGMGQHFLVGPAGTLGV